MSVQTGAPCKWTSDSKHFILENFDTIQNSPSQVYNSALTLCPSSSWLHEYYAAGVKVVAGPTKWGTCIRTVFFGNDHTFTLAYCNNTIATGFTNQDIIIFDALTGSQTAVLSGHTEYVTSLAFSLDGTLLVSGSKDNTIKLWDVQTGGAVKTFCGHTKMVLSVSISADNTMIASGSEDKTIRLWDIGTGQCCVIEEHNGYVNTVSFSPTNPQLLLSVSEDGTVGQWDINGHQIGLTYAGSCVAFSPDGAQFVSCAQTAVTVRNTDSGATIAEFHLADGDLRHCCFSPDRRFIAASAGHTIYLWDITGPDPHLVKSLIGHTEYITSLVFSSSLTLISASGDGSVRFWQISASSVDPAASDTESTLPTSAPISSVSLQSKDGLAFSIDRAGVVRTWDILTGLCKESFKTNAADVTCGDVQLINGRLIIVWREYIKKEIHIWDAEKGRLQTVDTTCEYTSSLRITGDGSRVLQQGDDCILAWFISTGEPAGKESSKGDYNSFDPLRIDGSKVLVYSGKSSTQGWDFGIPGSTPIQFSKASLDRPCLDFIDVRRWSSTTPVRVEDRVTGKEVFQLYGRYAEPTATQWDGQYLIAGYESGEVLILDFGDVFLE